MSEALSIHLSFASEIVDDFVAARAHYLNKVQHVPAPIRKRFNINQLRSTKFNKVWNLVRDQGVGGSNPPLYRNRYAKRTYAPGLCWFQGWKRSLGLNTRES